jgi:hypothetical protein
MSFSPRLTRSRSSSKQNNNNRDNDDDDLLPRGGDDDGSNKSATVAAATSRNNGGGKDGKNNNAQQQDDSYLPSDGGGNQPSRKSKRLQKQTAEHESDEDDDESDEDDDESDWEGTTKTSRRGNNQKKKRTNTKTKPLVTTTYKYPDDQFHISGWKKGRLPTPEEILERTQFYYEYKMNEDENYLDEDLWTEFVEDGKEKGIFADWYPYQAKKFYNQSKAVAKGDLPDQPFPNFESIEQIIEARLYSHHTAAALRKTYNDLYEYGRQNGIQGLIMIPRTPRKAGKKVFKADAYDILVKLSEQGNEKAIKGYDFVHAVERLRRASEDKGEPYAKSLVELLQNDGVVIRDDDENVSAHERRNQMHCHEIFLRFVLGDEADIQFKRKINLTRDPIELKEQILERENEKYFVHAKVKGICGMRQVEFCQVVTANAGGVEAIEEIHRNILLSQGSGLTRYLDKYHPERICEKCGFKSGMCSSLQHKGAGAIQIKRQRGGMHPADCTLEELETQLELIEECDDGSMLELLCLGCHRVEDLSTIARIAFGDIDGRSIEAGSYSENPERVLRYKAIQTARVENHITDIQSGEPLQLMNSPRNDAHHVFGCNQVALYDVASGEIFALDTAKRKHETPMQLIKHVDSMEDLVEKSAHWLASTVSMDANSHMILHVVIGLVERGQLNGGVLPFGCRGGYYMVPVGESENRDLYDLLIMYKKWFEKIDAKKVLACPRVSLKSGNILKKNETEDEDRRGDNDEDSNSEQIGRPNTASGDYTIPDDGWMAPQVPGFGTYHEDEKPSSGFRIPFSLEPGSGGDDSDDWFESDDRIREKLLLEEIKELHIEKDLLNKDVDQLTRVIGSYLGKLEESVPSDVVEIAISNLLETMKNDNGHVEFMEKLLREKDEEIASAKASEEVLENSLRRKNKVIAMAKASVLSAVDKIDELETDKEKLVSFSNELIDDVSRLEEELENEKRNRKCRETFYKQTIVARGMDIASRDMEIAELKAMVEQLSIENSRLKEGDEGTRKRPRQRV